MSVHVAGAASALDLVELSDHLSEAGVVHGVEAAVVRYDGTDAVLGLSFRGTGDDVLRFLDGLDGRGFAEGRSLAVEGRGRLRVVARPAGDGGG